MFEDKKGLTLIEVLLSISLLGLLAIMILPPLSNYLTWFNYTRINITESAFRMQDEMEAAIQKVINEMESGVIHASQYESLGIAGKQQIKLFLDDFQGYNSTRIYPDAYLIEIKDSAEKSFLSLVGDKRLPELPIPTINSVSNVFVRDNISSLVNYEYSSFPNLKILSKSNMVSNPSNSFNRYRSDWYISNPGFNIPIQDISEINEDFDFGRIYPSFPEDYTAVPIASELGSAYSFVSSERRDISVELSNSIVSRYSGRHILYSITPFSKVLKKGQTSTLFPLYLYGPEITNNLAIHLDASTIKMNDYYNSSSNKTGAIQVEGDIYSIRTWKNSRPSTTNISSNKSAVQNSSNYMPALLRHTGDPDNYTGHAIPFQEGELSKRVWSRALGNKSETMSTMKISDLDLGSNLNIFLVLRKTEFPVAPKLSTPILYGSDQRGNSTWSIGWAGNQSSPSMSLSDKTNTVVLNDTLDLGEWYLVQISTQTMLSLSAKSLRRDVNKHLYSESAKSLNTNTKTIDLNWNGIDISEILIYNSSLTQEQLTSIENYLLNKYNPEF